MHDFDYVADCVTARLADFKFNAISCQAKSGTRLKSSTRMNKRVILRFIWPKYGRIMHSASGLLAVNSQQSAAPVRHTSKCILCSDLPLHRRCCRIHPCKSAIVKRRSILSWPERKWRTNSLTSPASMRDKDWQFWDKPISWSFSLEYIRLLATRSSLSKPVTSVKQQSGRHVYYFWIMSNLFWPPRMRVGGAASAFYLCLCLCL